MIDLAIPLDPQRTGGIEPGRYLEQIAALGATAIELQAWLDAPLPQEQLRQLLRAACALGLRCHIHASTRTGGDSSSTAAALRARWEPIVTLAAEVAELQGAPSHLVIHPAGGRAPTLERYHQQTCLLTSWILSMSDSVRPMLELVPTSETSYSPRRWLRRWAERQRERRGQIAAPPGTTRDARYAPQLTARRPQPSEDDALTPCALERYSAGSSREALLALVEQIGDQRAGICWDLGHDWYQGQRLEPQRRASVPTPQYLRAVGHVHLHDALPNGQLHLPLQTGNVPYTTQLRALLAANFSGVVTLEIFFGRLALSLGRRFEVLERSLRVARSVLRLSCERSPDSAPGRMAPSCGTTS